ncbi:MAG: iron-sulfur cluster assembly accessory protein [Rhodothermales bacterium]|nr:iron-sulfur cluster assembly accessory protein [Rhodothermales bacterium]
MNISITESAKERVLQIASREKVNLAVSFLRFAVVQGGCSGLTYDLGWDTTVSESDEVGEVAGLPVVMDVKTQLYMDGTELDFSDGLEGKGFHFLNPQAERTCACGESFGL